jgi:steroid 5-alpha reductase family enzyme
MKKTASVLFVSVLAIPAVAIYFAEPLTGLQMEAIDSTVKIYLAVALLCFIISEITKNYSQVDKLWSIIPVVHAWNMASIGNFNERAVLMASLVTIWGVRLTMNFARRGGYSWKFWEGEEDYRWTILRGKMNFKQGWVWSLFNLFFISLYQMGLLLIMTYPMLFVLEGGNPIGVLDVLAAALMLGFIVYETIADNQQWNFQMDKHTFIDSTGKSGHDFEGGFNQRGLWKLSRHPNYFAEQSIWVTFYLFSVAATGEWLNWTITGAVLILMLFQGSSNFSEEITASKYPDYASYQIRTPRFIPNVSKLIRSQNRMALKV